MERSTKQRTAIVNAIQKAQRPLAPQEILDAARCDVPALGIATVYRNLKLLLDDNSLKRVDLPGETPRYELAHVHAHHHHHFFCTRCEKAFDIFGCANDFSAMAPSGFQVNSHEMTLYGYCDQCSDRCGDRCATTSTKKNTHITKKPTAKKESGE